MMGHWFLQTQQFMNMRGTMMLRSLNTFLCPERLRTRRSCVASKNCR
jgi:hypothetical protein